jgi:hypothetical protein
MSTEKKRLCAARNLASTVSKPGAIVTISNNFHPIQIATAIAKHIKRQSVEEEKFFVEQLTSFFDSHPRHCCNFFEFQTSEHLAEISKRD